MKVSNMNLEYLEKIIDNCDSESDWNLLIEVLEKSNFNISHTIIWIGIFTKIKRNKTKRKTRE